MAMDYTTFYRLAARAVEIAEAPGAPPLLVAVYNRSTQAPLASFIAAHAGVDDATTRLNRATADIEENLEEMTRLSDMALSAIAAVLPATKLPEPLKSQETDTDKRQMLQRLKTILDPHAGEAWADQLLQGDFGTLTTQFIQYLDDAIQAANDLQEARAERKTSFGLAWKAFLAFKRLVRSSYGRKSRPYQRLHVRASITETGPDSGKQPENGEATPPPEDKAAKSHAEAAPVSEAVPSVQ